MNNGFYEERVGNKEVAHGLDGYPWLTPLNRRFTRIPYYPGSCQGTALAVPIRDENERGFSRWEMVYGPRYFCITPTSTPDASALSW
jgi:hypothetical protein